MRYLIIAFLSFSFFSVKSQTYFPPLTGNSWDTLAPESLGWCRDSIQPLYSWLENTNSKAFILLLMASFVNAAGTSLMGI